MQESRRGYFIWVAGIVLVAAAGVCLRWWQLGAHSLWFDEGYSAWFASLRPAELLWAAGADVGPPLYYLLLGGWTAVFGESESGLRAMSALAATATFPVFFLLCRDVLKDRWAVLAAMALLAVSGLQIEYAQEARSYALMSFLVVTASYCLQRFLRTRTWWTWAVLVAAEVAGIYTHNTMFFYLAGLNLAWLVLPGAVPWRRRLLEMALTNALVALAYLPWAPVLIGQVRFVSGNFWVQRPDAGTLHTVLSRLAGCPPLQEATLGQPVALAANAAAVALVVAAMACRERLRGALAVALTALGPVVMVFVFSLWGRPIFITKIFVPTAGLLPILLAWPLAGKSRRVRRAAGIILVGIVLLAGVGTMHGYWRDHRHEQWRSACAYIDGLPRERRLLVFVANEGQLMYRYYARRTGHRRPRQTLTGCPQGFFDLDPPRPIRRVLHDTDVVRLRRMLAEGDFERVLLVLSHDWFADPGGRVEACLDNVCTRQYEKRWRDVRLVSYGPK